MAFFKYTGTYVRVYSSYDISAQPGLVYDLGVSGPPADGNWTADPGPATGTADNASVVYPPGVVLTSLAPLVPAWVTGVQYAAGQLVWSPNGSEARALTTHLSGVYATDLAAGKWSDASAMFGAVDLPAGFITGTTRRAQFAWGSGGASTWVAILNDAHQRLPIILPVTTTKWRLRISNMTPAGVKQAGVVSFTGAWLGLAATNGDGSPSGAFTAAPTQALTAFASPSDGSEFATSWVTDPALQFTARTLQQVAVGWTKAGGTTIQRGCGHMFYSNAASEASATAPALTQADNIAYRIAVEYEFNGAVRVGVAFGDSLTEGESISTTPAGFNINDWHQRLSQRIGLPIGSSAHYGTTTANWQTAGDPRYTSVTAGGLTADFAIIALGSNDASSSVALATYQANLLAVIAKVKALGIRDVYLATVAPRALTTTPEAIRVSYNAWLAGPALSVVRGAFDISDALTSPTDSTVLKAAFNCGDNTHWSPSGHQRASLAFPALL